MPWGAIEGVARIINTLLEGVPAGQRTATAIVWFWIWWPIGKRFVPADVQKQIEDIMSKIGKEPQA